MSTPSKRARQARGIKDDTELDAEDWKALTEEFKAIVREHKGFDFPQDPMEQLKLATEAVFKSWNGKPAIAYRNREKIAHDLGTGVNILTMVFGNMGWDSGTGVAFTRNPATGEKVLYGDYLMNAQGEDVVAGIRNTKPIAELAEEMPGGLCRVRRHLRTAWKSTTARCRTSSLPSSAASSGCSRPATASARPRRPSRSPSTWPDEGLITKEEAVLRVTPEQVDDAAPPPVRS